jgi:hypothetical protein
MRYFARGADSAPEVETFAGTHNSRAAPSAYRFIQLKVWVAVKVE